MQNSLSTSPPTLIGLIEAQQAALGLTDHDLSAAVGFEREIALTLIKAGSMRLPLTKVPALAAALELDPVELFKQALHESDPVLAKLIADMFNPIHLTATEVAQIKHQRKLGGNAVGVAIALQGEDVVTLVAVGRKDSREEFRFTRDHGL